MLLISFYKRGTLIDRAATRSVFAGSPKIQFSLPLTFISLSEEEDSRNPILTLSKMTLPTTGGSSFQSSISRLNTPSQVTVSVGGWLRATNLLLKSCDVSFSKEFMLKEDGKTTTPLVTEVNCTFESYYQVTAEIFNTWFPGAVAKNENKFSQPQGRESVNLRNGG